MDELDVRYHVQAGLATLNIYERRSGMVRLQITAHVSSPVWGREATEAAIGRAVLDAMGLSERKK